MSTFRQGEFAIDLAIEPLEGALAEDDRRCAWLLYVAIIVRPAVRGGFLGDDSVPAGDVGGQLREFLHRLENIMAQWPAAGLDTPRATGLGHFLGAVVEMILLPFLKRCDDDNGAITDSSRGDWLALRDFFRALAGELAKTYDFPHAMGQVPRELIDGLGRAP